MSEMTPDRVSDDDIPTLTDIVVPGRLPLARGDAASPSQDAATGTAGDFVFDIDFDVAVPQPRRDEPTDRPVATGRTGPDDEADLPLPWTEPGVAQSVTSAPSTLAPDSPSQPVTPHEHVDTRIAPAPQPAVEEAAVAPLDAALDPQRLQALRARVLERLEQCLHEELARAESRLRDALRSELDATLAELRGPSSIS